MIVTLTISRADILARVNAESAILAQRFANGETNSFNDIWASPSDEGKLDLYYRDAIMSLEELLSKYIDRTMASQNAIERQKDYQLRLSMPLYWKQSNENLLKNKIIDYVTHIVLASWIKLIPGLTGVDDYIGASAADESSICQLLNEIKIEGAQYHRHRDNTEVTHERDAFDMSGTHIAELMDPTREMLRRHLV